MIGAIASAFRLLTIVPVPLAGEPAGSLRRAAGVFPLVGLGIGSAVAATAWGALHAMPAMAAAALALASWVVLTGALHFDGLADTADGLFGGQTPQRRLEIMRDPHTGAFGVVAVSLALLLKLALVDALVDSGAWLALAFAPVGGRTAVVLAMKFFPYLRTDGMGSPFVHGAKLGLMFACLLAVTVAFALLQAPGLLLLAAGIAGGMAVAWYSSRRLGGGLTGDVYGAAIIAGEIAGMLSAIILLGLNVPLTPVWD